MEIGIIIGLVILNIILFIDNRDKEHLIRSLRDSKGFYLQLNDRANKQVWDMAWDIAEKNNEINKLKEELVRIELDKETECKCTKKKRSVKK